VRSRWERLDEILDMLEAFVVAPRGDVTAAELEDALSHISPERRKKVHYLDSTPLVAESATLVRGRLAGRHTVRYLVPEPVFRYIEENELYR
jgi:nicotinic acid mononucleotide adenylyltransferase